MKKLIGLTLSIALGLTAIATIPVAAGSENSRNNIGDTETSGVVSFADADVVNSFLVTIPDGKDGDARNGRLTVETQDFNTGCVDYWGVRILKHNGKVMADAVGDGSATNLTEPEDGLWSGAATIPALPRKGVTVEVYYDSGCDTFTAGMWVQYTFTGENIEVTPVP